MSVNANFNNLVLSELARAWSNFVYKMKWTDFGLTPPNFIVTDVTSYLGQWRTSTREMAFSSDLIANKTWNQVLEVLKHEMAHQFVHEVLHIEGETAHGPTFQSVCKQYDIDAAAHSDYEDNKTTATNHIVEKVRHLLNLADNAAATDEEKETAATAAHNLMLKYNIELQDKREEKGYTVAYLGGVTGRIQGYMSALANMLHKYYFVECIWTNGRDLRTGKDGHELEVSGTKENIEVAEYVYDFVSREAVKAWEKKIKTPEYQHQMYTDIVNRKPGVPHSAQGYTISARFNFLLGFVEGYMSQLQAAMIQEEKAGLVLAKDTGLEQYYHQRHPHIRSLTRGAAHQNTNLRNQGRQAGSALKVPPAAKANKTFVPLLGK